MNMHETLIRNRLREARLKLNLTEDDVAKKLGKASNAFISRIENGPQKLNIETISKLCKIYNITPANLFKDLESSSPQPQNFFTRVSYRAQEETLSLRVKDKIRALLPNLRKLGRVMRDLNEPPLNLNDFYKNQTVFKTTNTHVARKFGKEVATTLRQYCQLGSDPIADIQDFIWHHIKVPVCGIDFDKDCWGFYSKDNFDNPLILYSTAHQYQQRNVFTIAHELGHHFYNPNEGHIDNSDPATDSSSSEAFSNAFAQEFLVPTSAMNDYYDEYGLNFVTLEAKHVVELCNHFKVSYQMMCWVLSSQNKIKPEERDVLLVEGKRKNLAKLNYFKSDHSESKNIEYYLKSAIAKGLRKNVINKLLASEILDITTKEVEQLI